MSRRRRFRRDWSSHTRRRLCYNCFDRRRQTKALGEGRLPLIVAWGDDRGMGKTVTEVFTNGLVDTKRSSNGSKRRQWTRAIPAASLVIERHCAWRGRGRDLDYVPGRFKVIRHVRGEALLPDLRHGGGGAGAGGVASIQPPDARAILKRYFSEARIEQQPTTRDVVRILYQGRIIAAFPISFYRPKEGTFAANF